MKIETLQSISLAIAHERNLDSVLLKVVGGLVDDENVALARIWLIAAGGECTNCRSQSKCFDQRSCLKLMASAGNPVSLTDEDWSRLNGEFSRIPLGAGKIGTVAATGTPALLSDVSLDWSTRKEFAERERIRTFAAQPLVYRGDVFGVLAIFGRSYLDEENFSSLRSFADHAAAALARARGFEESTRERLDHENSSLREEPKATLSRGDMVGRSASLKKVFEQIDFVSPTEAIVLIEGESGTGKELVAEAVHHRSRRRDRPMIRVNCASVPRDLFESEFFGHSKGAFTGALRDRSGRFQFAEGGTLFLDEVGEIPLELQGKLLRVLQDGQYERVGDDLTRQANVRIVAATNRDLRSEVANGRFREDLFYRLRVFPIHMPPLRERKEDIGLLAAYLLEAACRRLKVPTPLLPPQQVQHLSQYDWPGNVRELQNVIERAVIMSRDGLLGFDGLIPERMTAAQPVSLHHHEVPAAPFYTEAAWIEMDRENLSTVLQLAGGKVGGPGGAAELLGLRPTTLRSRLKARGIRHGR